MIIAMRTSTPTDLDLSHKGQFIPPPTRHLSRRGMCEFQTTSLQYGPLRISNLANPYSRFAPTCSERGPGVIGQPTRCPTVVVSGAS